MLLRKYNSVLTARNQVKAFFSLVELFEQDLNRLEHQLKNIDTQTNPA